MGKKYDYVGAMIVIYDYLLEHPSAPTKLLRKEVNRGGVDMDSDTMAKVMWNLKRKYGSVSYDKEKKTYSLNPGASRWLRNGGFERFKAKHGRL